MKPLFAAVAAAAAAIAVGALFAAPDGKNAKATGNPEPRAIDAAVKSPRIAVRTVTLKVQGMSCVTCPLIVRRALERVEGVAAAEVSFRQKTAVIRYDPAKCDVNALMAATNSIGFPSRVIEP